MRVLVCPTAFKESLSARQVTAAAAEGVRQSLPAATVRAMPVSDGGPGLLESIAASEGGDVRHHEVTGPLGEPVQARSLWVSPSEAVIEAADACGLHLVPEERRDPLRGDTRGVGALVSTCLQSGATRIALGLGGSATVDGGTGLARVFGYRFLGPDGDDLPAGGGSLGSLARIEPGEAPGRLASVTAVADVYAPLTGPNGAARVFAPQKGASPAQVDLLENGLTRLADRLRVDLGADVADLPGSGASGGLGAGCVAFLDADLVGGSEWVLRRLGFDAALECTDLVVTGEGAWDATSGLGKITWEILSRARAAGVPAVLVCGRATGPEMTNVTVVDGSGAWLAASDVTRLVAEAVG